MIRNEAEYQEASQRLAQGSLRLAEHRACLKGVGLGHEEIKRVIDPIPDGHPKSPTCGHFKFLHLTS